MERRRGRLRKVVEDRRGVYVHTNDSIISPLTRPTCVLPTDIKINIITNVEKTILNQTYTYTALTH